jgi:hypothetical protein
MTNEKEIAVKYYQSQLDRIETKGKFNPSIKIHNGEGGGSTKYMDLNPDSAEVLIKWLTEKFLTK